MKNTIHLGLLACVLLAASTVSAATFVVRTDRDLVQRAQAIVVGSALTSYSRLNAAGGIETVTPISVDEVIKGDVALSTINVIEPGGVHGDLVSIVSGVPQFQEGRPVLLFLMKTAPDHWSVFDLVVGKFTFAHDRLGQKLLVRDEDEVAGYDPDLSPHVEKRRAADRFLDFVRAEAHGRKAATDYIVPTAELDDSQPVSVMQSTKKVPLALAPITNLQPVPLVAPFSANSYTMTISGSLGSRWNVFPSAVPFYMGTTQESGAPGGGSPAIQTAIASWDNDCGSNVNYTFAGTDDGTHTQGLHGPDGRNTVLFERDLSAWGVAPFSCSGNSYSGTLGLGGVTSASGSNTVAGEAFVTTNEGDVEMNRGLANCTVFLTSGDFNSALTHEVGHTLGFRHADQNRPSSAACSTDASLECSSRAIMTAVVTPGINAALQQWDINAVRAVYPGGSCGTGGCPTPTVSVTPSSVTINSGQSVTLTSTTTNVTAQQWYIGQAGDTSHPISGAGGSTLTVSPGSTTRYWVWALNSCGTSAISNTATVTVNVCAQPTATISPASTTINAGQGVTLTVSTTNVTALQWYIGSAGDTSRPISGAGGSSIFVAPGSTTNYWVWALNSCGKSVVSNTATVFVNACATPTATISPASVTISAGQSTTLTVSTGGGVTGLQWYVGSAGDTSHPVSGGTRTTLTVSPTATTRYWVWALNNCSSVISNTATVTVR